MFRLKKIFASHCLFACLCIQGCVTPVNLNFEDASSLGKGTVEIKPAYSQYYDMDYPDLFENTEFQHHNAGVSIGVGLNDNHDLKLKGEYLFSEFGFLEVDNKLKANDGFAASFPIQLYFDNKGYFVLGYNPRMYFDLFRETRHFQLTLIPKGFIFLDSEGGGIIYPAISLCAGANDILDNLSVRSAFGSTIILRQVGTGSWGIPIAKSFYSMSFGIAVSYRFSVVQKQ